MPLTKQIILDAVRTVVKEEVSGLKTHLDALETRFDTLETRFDTLETRFDTLEQKVDNLSATVTDFAGQVKKFDEEQTVLSHRSSIHSKQIEDIQRKVFGEVQTL